MIQKTNILLVFVLATSLFIGACAQGGSSTGSGSIGPDGDFSAGIPKAVLENTTGLALTATLTVDEGTPIELTITADGKVSKEVRDLSPGEHTFTIQYLLGGKLFASVTTSVLVVAGQQTPVSFPVENLNLSPTATIRFPTKKSLTNGETLTITGTASDADGIQEVRVNGVLATTTDGFTTWKAVVKLNAGKNAIVVRTKDNSGHINPKTETVEVTRSELLIDPKQLALDLANKRAYVLDDNLDALLVIDLLTGIRTIVSDSKISPDNSFKTPSGIALDLRVDIRQAFVLDQGSGALFKIDLETGRQTIIGGTNLFEFPVAVVLDTSNERNLAYVTDAGILNPPALFQIDLSTGARKTVSGGSVGQGGIETPFINPSGIALDIASDLAYVTDLGRKALLSVPIRTGIRTVVSDGNNGTGSDFQKPSSIALALPKLAYITDEVLGALIEVNLSSHDRTIVSGGVDRIGAGPDLRNLSSVALDREDPDNINAYVIDDELKVLVKVDLSAGPSKGKREIFFDNATGVATNFFSNLTGIALSADGQQAFLTDKGLKALVAVNLSNGNRTILSDITHGNDGDGNNFAFDKPSGIAVDRLTNQALVIDDGLSKKLISVDLTTGNRRVASDPLTLNNPTGIALDSLGKAFVIDNSDTDSDTLFKVDPLIVNGEKTIIAGGTPFSFPRGLALVNDLAFVVDAGQRALFAVNLSIGNRLSISNGTGGPALINPAGVALDTSDRAFIIDEGLRMLLSVDLKADSETKGDRKIISENPKPDLDPAIRPRGIGTPFISPSGLALDIANNRAFIIDTGLNALSLVDLGSGDRVIISR